MTSVFSKAAMIRWMVAGMMGVLLFGCSKDKINFATLTPDEQLAYAKSRFEKRDYYGAKMNFTVIVLNNPGSRLIEEAQYYLGESHYRLKEYLLAIEEYEKLIRSLPQSEFVDDASYKVALSYYMLSPNYGHDQEYTNKAILQFQQFLEDYPDSDLREEAQVKLDECREKLAKKEFKSGELYRKMGYYRAALVYYQDVLDSYYDTSLIADALYWKAECHKRIAEWEQAEKLYSDLITRYPDSGWAGSAQTKLEDVRREMENAQTEEEPEQ